MHGLCGMRISRLAAARWRAQARSCAVTLQGSYLILQRTIDHAYEVSHRAGVDAELRIIIGVGPRGDDFVLALPGGFQFRDPVARDDKHLSVIAHHRLSAGRPMAR